MPYYVIVFTLSSDLKDRDIRDGYLSLGSLG